MYANMYAKIVSECPATSYISLEMILERNGVDFWWDCAEEAS
jgi:hypothetical protein